MSKSTCWHCAAGVQLFKPCQNLSASIVLQGCSCLSSVGTYLPALCCRIVAVLAVSKPTCRHCNAGVQLFKRCRNIPAGHCAAGLKLFQWCLNLPARHCAAGVQLLKRCQNLSAGTVLQGCSCFSGVQTYLLALCCRVVAI